MKEFERQEKANVNLSNSTAITNCLTHIPQDIKLELVDGTLTLKAGSKVYKPNGFEVDGTTPKFDIVTIESDLIFNFSSGNGIYFLFTSKDYFLLSMCSSGTTDSLAGRSWHIWYDTANNLIKLFGDNGNSPLFNVSFPIGIVTVSNNVVTSMDQDFNGFGYIGSTVFALPGVEGLIPNGRNKDGSLRNIKFEIDKVITDTTVLTKRDNQAMWFDFNVKSFAPRGLTFTFDKYVNADYNLVFDTQLNKYFYRFTGNYEETVGFVIGFSSIDANAKYTSLTTKTTFHAVDYNDSAIIDGWGIPDYTAGIGISSGYKAISNGFVYIVRGTGSSSVSLYVDGVEVDSNKSNTSTEGGGLQAYVKKGSVVTWTTGNITGTPQFFPCIGG